MDLVASYDAAAPGWERMLARLGYPSAYAAFLREAAPAGRVLDLGCGTGDLSIAALAAGSPDAITLADPSAAMRARAGARLASMGVTAATVDGGVGDPRIGAAAFDVVLVGHVIEHLGDPDAALRWIAGRLAPGGTAALTVSRPHWCTMLVRLRWGSRAYRPPAVLRMLEAAGLAGARAVPLGPGPPGRTSCGYVAHAAGALRPAPGAAK